MMLFWILFLLIILISAILAYLSMKDFGCEYGLFLIRKPAALTPKMLDRLHQMIAKTGEIFSLERLFKGGESALVIYGPKGILKSLVSNLDLVELEDYSKEEVEAIAWEMEGSNKLYKQSLFLEFPKLDEGEQVWYQIVLKAQKDKYLCFKGQIRAVVLSSDPVRRRKLSEVLQAQPFSSLQIMEIYRKRSMVGESFIKLTGEEIVRLWSLPKKP